LKLGYGNSLAIKSQSQWDVVRHADLYVNVTSLVQ